MELVNFTCLTVMGTAAVPHSGTGAVVDMRAAIREHDLFVPSHETIKINISVARLVVYRPRQA